MDLDRRIIEVRAGQAKTASRRVIPITDNLASWLAPLPRRGRVVPSCTQHKEITALAKSLGIPWPRNVLRHSFISYRIAILKSADQVALREPVEKPGPGAGMGLMGWRDLDVLDVVAGVPVRAVALFPHGSVAPQSKVTDLLLRCASP